LTLVKEGDYTYFMLEQIKDSRRVDMFNFSQKDKPILFAGPYIVV